jgi:hypothetical protein
LVVIALGYCLLSALNAFFLLLAKSSFCHEPSYSSGMLFNIATVAVQIHY